MTANIIDVSSESFATEVEHESSSRPVLVDYWADWCGPCKALAPVLSRVVESFEGRLRLAKLDTQANQALAQQHGIRSLPTVRLFRDGRAVAEFMGAQPESSIRDFIARFAELSEEGPITEARRAYESGQPEQAVMILNDHIDANPDDHKARIALAQAHFAMRSFAQAQACIDALPQQVRSEDPVPALLAQIRFASASADSDGDSVSDDATSPESRYQHALRAIASGSVEEGMDILLSIVREHREFRDDGARKAMLDAFLALGADDPRVAHYRSQLFSLLH